MSPSRRELLMGAVAAAALAACGDSKASKPDSTVGSAFQVVQRFPDSPLFTPGPVRLPVSLGDGSNLLTTGPASIAGWIATIDGERVVDITATLRDKGIVVPYWEVRADIPTPGFYAIRLEGDDGAGAAFQVFEPTEVASPLTGKPLPPFLTPTVDNHRGVEPYCTLTPTPCPFHALTLTDALKAGTPVVYIVGTPAHCQTGTCAPGLEFLVAEGTRLGTTVTIVHADVYADDAATTVAPAVAALNVDYEPIIYFCDASGTVVDRLDGVWDSAELRERLDLLLAA
jgi:hypothetical protein